MARPGAGGLHQTSPGISTWRDEGLWISLRWGRILGVHHVISSSSSVGWALPLSVVLHLAQLPLQAPLGPSLPI